MEDSSLKSESWVSSPRPTDSNPEHEFHFQSSFTERNGETRSSSLGKKTMKKKQVLVEGYVERSEEEDLRRTKSLTDEDLEELKGCLDLGFGFSYDEIPELCNTLPALELCYSISQRFLDDHQNSPETTASEDSCSVSSPIANWRISSPGDHPEDVKARLKFWAQAVACTVKLCS